MNFPVFNELSLQHPFQTENEAIAAAEGFAKTAKKLQAKGLNKIRSEQNTREIFLWKQENQFLTLHEWLFDKRNDYSIFLASMIIKPFIDEEDSDKEQQYMQNDFTLESNGLPCPGLAAAYLYDTLSLSFANGATWQTNDISICVTPNTGTKKTKKVEIVKNVYSENCLEDTAIQNFIQQRSVSLKQTDIAPQDKDLHLSPHHGQKELQDFWERLRESPYVVSAKSTKWGGKQFIRKTHSSGEIEIVLTETQKSYALMVQTTGKNIWETKAIAEKLKNQFT
jgi:hypothetical protein